jgi:hypothetical protein
MELGMATILEGKEKWNRGGQRGGKEDNEDCRGSFKFYMRLRNDDLDDASIMDGGIDFDATMAPMAHNGCHCCRFYVRHSY